MPISIIFDLVYYLPCWKKYLILNFYTKDRWIIYNVIIKEKGEYVYWKDDHFILNVIYYD